MRTSRMGLPLLLALIVVAGCGANRPVLYPNERLAKAGAASQQDIDECMQLAEQYVSADPRTRNVIRDTAVGTGTGAAAGAVGGAIWGSAARGAAAGAAGGATAGLLHALLNLGSSDNPMRRRYTEACLSERGYRVIGWE